MWITSGWASLLVSVVWVLVRTCLPCDWCYFCSFFLCTHICHLLAPPLSLQSWSESWSRDLPLCLWWHFSHPTMLMQKIWHPKACFFLYNKTHTSAKHANLSSPFPGGFMPLCSFSLQTLQPGTGTKSWLAPFNLEAKAWQISLSSSLCCPALWLEAEHITMAEVKKRPPLLIIWLVLSSTKK